ncbi:PPOX class F420-dependent oxidoreductase [Streptomyces violaceoruber]
MDDDASLARLGAGKYLLVTTYRKNGTPVATPVWVVRDGDALGVWTVSDSWKVKRVRNHADVLVGPCDVRGRPTGEQVPGTAEICDAATTARYRRLLARKYGVLGRLTLLGSRLRRGLDGTLGIRVTLTSAPPAEN